MIPSIRHIEERQNAHLKEKKEGKLHAPAFGPNPPVIWKHATGRVRRPLWLNDFCNATLLPYVMPESNYQRWSSLSVSPSIKYRTCEDAVRKAAPGLFLLGCCILPPPSLAADILGRGDTHTHTQQDAERDTIPEPHRCEPSKTRVRPHPPRAFPAEEGQVGDREYWSRSGQSGAKVASTHPSPNPEPHPVARALRRSGSAR